MTALLLASLQVAVFCERGFPFFGSNQAATPKRAALLLRSLGIGADLLGADELVDPKTFHAGRYAVFVNLYGNTFPLEALPNLVRFHEHGGCIVNTGVPFTHPCVREFQPHLKRSVWRDLGHKSFGGHEGGGIGVGLSAGGIPEGEATLLPSPRAPFPLPLFDWRRARLAPGVKVYFYPDPNSLPPEDEVLSALSVVRGGEVAGFPVAVIRHGCRKFKGALDVWAGTQILSDPREVGEAVALEALVAHAVIYVLTEKGLLDRKRADVLHRKVDALRRPEGRVEGLRPKGRAVAPRAILPRSPRASKALYVLSVEREPWWRRVEASCLQGLVNRERPKVYLLFDQYDELWLNWYRKRGYVKAIKPVGSVKELFYTFGNCVKGAVLSDERFLNIAVMFGAVYGLVPVPSVEEARRLGLRVVADFRGRWDRHGVHEQHDRPFGNSCPLRRFSPREALEEAASEARAGKGLHFAQRARFGGRPLVLAEEAG